MPYSFPFLQMGLFVLVLFGLEVILSFWTMRRQKINRLWKKCERWNDLFEVAGGSALPRFFYYHFISN